MFIKALAYGALTSLNPVHGLYTSFYGGLIYALFGTSRHLSVGAFAVTSLMVYSTIHRVESEIRPQLALTLTQRSVNDLHQNSTSSFAFKPDAIDSNRLRAEISTCLAFWCGVFQVRISLKSYYCVKL